MPTDYRILEIEDLHNGGGFNANVSNIAGSSSTTLAYMSVYDWFGTPDVWTDLSPAISSPGPYPASVSVGFTVPHPGYYWFHLYSADRLRISNIVRARISGAEETIWYQLGVAIQDTIQGAILTGGFPGIDDPEKVCLIYQYNPSVLPVDIPGIAVCYGDQKKVPTGGTNESDDKWYPITVLGLGRANRNKLVDSDDPFFRWHEEMENLFLHQRQALALVQKNDAQIVSDIEITYPQTVDFIRNRYEEVQVGLQLNVRIRELRGP